MGVFIQNFVGSKLFGTTWKGLEEPCSWEFSLLSNQKCGISTDYCDKDPKASSEHWKLSELLAPELWVCLCFVSILTGSCLSNVMMKLCRCVCFASVSSLWLCSHLCPVLEQCKGAAVVGACFFMYQWDIATWSGQSIWRNRFVCLILHNSGESSVLRSCFRVMHQECTRARSGQRSTLLDDIIFGFAEEVKPESTFFCCMTLHSFARPRLMLPPLRRRRSHANVWEGLCYFSQRETLPKCG